MRDEFLSSGAVFSPCGRYRYRLHRRWSMGPRWALFVMLNPSTADAHQLDPTVRRCVNYSKAWGYDGLMVGNVYGLRSTDPRELWRCDDPVGPENERHLGEMAAEADLIVAAWGGNAKVGHVERTIAVLRAHGDIAVLRVTKTGEPGHPLYLRADLRPVPWVRRTNT